MDEVPSVDQALGASFSTWSLDLEEAGWQGSSSLPSFPGPCYILHVGNPKGQGPGSTDRGRELCVSWPLLWPVPTGRGNVRETNLPFTSMA